MVEGYLIDEHCLQNISTKIRVTRRDRGGHPERPLRTNQRRDAIRDGKNM